MGKFVKWSIGGLVAALLGAAGWAAIMYWTGYEIGWLAWGVGVLAGLGVRVAADETDDGFGPGMVAASAAVIALLLGKYFAVQLIVGRELGNVDGMIAVTAADFQMSLCEEVLDEWADKKLKWRKGMSRESVQLISDYPETVQKEAQKRWDALGVTEQQRQIAERQAMLDELGKSYMRQLRGDIVQAGFKQTFSIMDVAFFILALITAFKIGSNLQSGHS